jgi:hypothetical protein
VGIHSLPITFTIALNPVFHEKKRGGRIFSGRSFANAHLAHEMTSETGTQPNTLAV